jgi:allantoate deiminase
MDALSGKLIEERLLALATFTDVPGEMTRLSLTPAHRAAVDHLAILFQKAGMRVHVDGTGSLVGRYEGATPDAKVLLIGSHIDTVRKAGIYDGNFGVICGLNAIESLHRERRRLPFAIELIAFADEEGARFPTTLTSSRAIAGRFDPASLDEKDGRGVTRRVALERFGAPLEQIATIARDPATVLGYVEVHIEQGPVLEAKGLPVGIVTAINGASRGEITIAGTAGHAGTLPMAMRHDAAVAAAEIVLAIEALARGRDPLVATTGVLEIPGGAINVVPGLARMTLDIRSPDDAQRQQAVADIRHLIEEIAARRGVTADLAMRHEAPAAPCDPALSDAIERAVVAEGIEPYRLPSGAGHDGMALSGVLPIAMLFTRCRDGISHNPAEYASPDDMGVSARVLRRLLLDLAASVRS